MAQETNYQATSDIRVLIGTEATFGTVALSDGAGVWKELPVTAYTIPEISAPIDVAAQRSGKFVNYASQVKHRPDQKVYTFDLTLKGTPTSVLQACQWLFEDGTSEADFTGDYAFPKNTYKDAIASTTQVTVVFENAGADASLNDIQCKSCIATGLTLNQDITAESGQLACTVNMMTGYQPEHVTFADVENVSYTSGSYTKDTATPKNLRDITTAYINGGAQEDLVLYSWELSINRSVERIHYSETSTFKPFGLVMTGAMEATGSLTAKRDDAVHDLLAKFKDSNTVAINLAEASGFTIDIPKAVLNEPGVESGGNVLTQTLPFTAFGTDATSSGSIVGITIA